MVRGWYGCRAVCWCQQCQSDSCNFNRNNRPSDGRFCGRSTRCECNGADMSPTVSVGPSGASSESSSVHLSTTSSAAGEGSSLPDQQSAATESGFDFNSPTEEPPRSGSGVGGEGNAFSFRTSCGNDLYVNTADTKRRMQTKGKQLDHLAFEVVPGMRRRGVATLRVTSPLTMKPLSRPRPVHYDRELVRPVACAAPAVRQSSARNARRCAASTVSRRPMFRSDQ